MTQTKALNNLAVALLNQSIVLAQLKRHQAAIDKCDLVVARFSKFPQINFKEKVGNALLQKAVFKADQGSHKESIEICDQLIERFSAYSEPGIVSCVARAYYSKGLSLADELHDFDEALSSFERAASIFRDLKGAESLRRRGDALIRQAHTLYLKGEKEPASELYKAIRAEIEPRIVECPLQVASSWLNHGFLFSHLGHPEDSLALHQRVIDQFHTRLTPQISASEDADDIRRIVANSWLNVTADLAELRREVEKIAVCQELIREFEKDEHPKIQAIVARAYFNLARGYEEENETEKAIECYRYIDEKFGENPLSWVQDVVAQSLVNLALRLEYCGDIEGAISIGARVWRAFGSSNNDDLRKQAFMGLANKTRALTKQTNRQRELDGYAEILEYIEHVKMLGMGDAVAMAFLNRATEQWSDGQHKEAFQDWDSLLVHFNTSIDPSIEAKVAQTYDIKSKAHKVLGDFAAEKSCYLEAIEVFRNRDSHTAHEAMLWAYCSLGQFLLEEESDQSAALSVWNEGLALPYIDACRCFGPYKQQMRDGVNGSNQNSINHEPLI